MGKSTKFVAGASSFYDPSNFFKRDMLTEALRSKIRVTIETLADEELTAVLEAGDGERTDSRKGYRHGFADPRELSTSFGSTEIKIRRGRVVKNGKVEEWQSSMLPRYARRAAAVDQAILGIYVGGVNTRRIKTALRPLLKGTPLSKSSVSRLIQRLKVAFEAWQTQSLKDVRVMYLYLDGFGVNVRLDGRVVRVPVLAALGVLKTGEKILLSLTLMGSESGDGWKSVLEDLSGRGMKPPKLVISDGGSGLQKAIREIWPTVDIQRCAVHKLRNLLAKAPEHSHDAITEDFHKIVYAKNHEQAQVAYQAFLNKWRSRCEGVARSLEEAGGELLTFYRYPESQWRSLRTTNAIERLNQEFRRRMKTQGSLPSSSSVLILMYALVMSGQIPTRKIDGAADMPADVSRVPDHADQAALPAAA
jgi:transposase-like protein